MPDAPIRVAVTGAAGRMGREVVRAVSEAPGIDLVAAVMHSEIGADSGELSGLPPNRIPIAGDLASIVSESKPHVLVDFTVAPSALANTSTALRSGVAADVGTTGITPEDMARVARWSEEAGTAVLIAPNFAIGAVLMMRFAEQAARHLPDAEIIELHHEKKVDSPSGTALLTADKIARARETNPTSPPPGTSEKVPGARGAEAGSVHIHSVRLPGFVAHQEVIFGGLGQTLTIRHDSTQRVSFMPGVILAIKSVIGRPGLTVGLEPLLDLPGDL